MRQQRQVRLPLLELDRSSPVRSSATDLVWLQSVLLQSRYPLPQSYLDFAEAYGYGRALGLFIMYAPMSTHPDSLLVQGDKVRGFIRMAIERDYMEYGPDGTRELAEQLLPFAMSENGEYLAWAPQPDMLGATGRPEYPIYCICARMAGLRYGGRDLDELMRRLTSEEVKSALGPGYSPLPKIFQPLG